MPRVHAADDETVVACPDCDAGGDVHRRIGENTHAGDPDATYICGACSATFDDYETRPPKTPDVHSPESYGLDDLSPEDVGLSPMDECQEDAT